jgi:dTDP-glucose 4,6-dehydratase
MSKILILGATSFSGNAFANRLKTTEELVLLGRRNEIPRVFNALDQAEQPGFEVIRWNINENQDDLFQMIEQENVTEVVNFAAQSMVGQSWEKPQDWYEANVMSFSKLINGLAKMKRINKFIHFSTPEVYGSTEGWIKESFNFAPNTPYAISRAASDWHLKALHENFCFPVIFTRAANVYGEYQRLYRIVPRVIFSALTGQKLPLQGGGKSIRSFIHIDDVSEALLKIIKNGTPGESYHISTNELITIHDLVAMVAAKLDVKLADLVEVVPERPGKDFAYQLDSQKIRIELDWEDQISLSDGIDRTINWVQSNLSELQKMPINYEHRR